MVAGTATLDPSRLWLLLIPLSAWFACHRAGIVIERLGGWTWPQGQSAVGILAIRNGVGLAGLSVIAVLSALSGLFWLSGIVMLGMAAIELLFVTLKLDVSRVTSWLSETRWHDLLSGTFGGLIALVAWLWATVPPTFYDELAYHLVIPERTLATGSLPTYPWVLFTLMPHVSDLWLAWGMAIGGGVGARAMHWGIWISCLIAGWALIDATVSRRHSRWAVLCLAAAVATSPTVWFLGTLPFAETGLTLAVLSCLLIAASSPPSRPAWIFLGLLLGLTGMVKLSGLAWIAATLFATVVLRWPWRAVLKSSLLMVAMMAPWWVRAYVVTGNPVYPMAYSVLGGGPWSETSQALLKGDLPWAAPELGWKGIISLPVDLILHPERFGSASEVGILAIVAVGVVFLLPVLSRITTTGLYERARGDAAAIFVGLTMVAWLLTSTTVRFFAPTFLFGLLVVIILALRFGRAGALSLGVLLIPLALWGTTRFLDQHQQVFSATQVALGQEDREGYLTRQVGYYEAARFVQTRVPATARLLFIGEARQYYFAREAMAPYPFDSHPLAGWVRAVPTSEALVKRLEAEGITHVVLNIPEFRRLNSRYHILAFSGEQAALYDRRLHDLPRLLRQVFSKNGVYIFEVPRTA